MSGSMCVIDADQLWHCMLGAMQLLCLAMLVLQAAVLSVCHSLNGSLGTN